MLFLVALEINYPSYCSVYYEIKQTNKASNLVFPVDYTENPALPERIQRVSVRELSSFVEKIGTHDGTKFVRSGLDWMVYGSFHKSLKPLFYWPETLALSYELLKLVCDWLSRTKTIVKTTVNRI